MLQRLADRQDRVNLLLIRARKASDVDPARRTGSSASRRASSPPRRPISPRRSTAPWSARAKLSDRLGLLLAIVALSAAVVVAALLVLAGVAKRTRELGSAAGARVDARRASSRSCSASRPAVGILGAVLGIALGFGAAALVAELVPPLEASAPSKISLGSLLGGGTGPAPRAEIPLHAPVDGSLLALAVALALGAALLAGAAGRRARRAAAAGRGAAEARLMLYELRRRDARVPLGRPAGGGARRASTSRIDAGEHVAVTGPSGSGKTTLLQLLGALDKPTSGLAALRRPRPRRAARARADRPAPARLGFVFQQFNLVPTLTARGNVEAALDPLRLRRAERRRRAHERLDEVGLADRAGTCRRSSRAASSSGWRSPARWPPSRASCSPTSRPASLDQAATDAIAGLLGSLAGERTVLVVTHDLGLAARAPRVVRLRDGRVEADGASDSVVGLAAVELPGARRRGGERLVPRRARARAGRGHRARGRRRAARRPRVAGGARPRARAAGAWPPPAWTCDDGHAAHRPRRQPARAALPYRGVCPPGLSARRCGTL